MNTIEEDVVHRLGSFLLQPQGRDVPLTLMDCMETLFKAKCHLGIDYWITRNFFQQVERVHRGKKNLDDVPIAPWDLNSLAGYIRDTIHILSLKSQEIAKLNIEEEVVAKLKFLLDGAEQIVRDCYTRQSTVAYLDENDWWRSIGPDETIAETSNSCRDNVRSELSNVFSTFRRDGRRSLVKRRFTGMRHDTAGSTQAASTSSRTRGWSETRPEALPGPPSIIETTYNDNVSFEGKRPLRTLNDTPDSTSHWSSKEARIMIRTGLGIDEYPMDEGIYLCSTVESAV
jgi:hypothetical protein